MKSSDKFTIPVPTKSSMTNAGILEGISWSYHDSLHSHHDLAAMLAGKHPYTVTILIALIDSKLRNRKEYVKKTRVPVIPKYKELLYAAFDKEYGYNAAGELYRKWLEQYRSLFTKDYRLQNPDAVDDYILEHELAPRYKQRILARFKNHDKLFQERHRIDRERYYNLPEPFQRVDWRNPYDNIFIWEEDGHKVARRGGSGSSGGRETNSRFILGLLELNKTQPVPSYLFVYSRSNELKFVKKFDSLCVPAWDIGANYHQASFEEMEQLKQGGLFLEWDILSAITEVEVIRK